MTKLQVDKIASRPNAKTTKCQVECQWQNDKLTKWQVDKMVSWQNGKLTKLQIDKIASWQNGKLIKW